MPKEETIELRHIRGVIGEKEDLPSLNPRVSLSSRIRALITKTFSIPQLIHLYGSFELNKTLTTSQSNISSLFSDGTFLYALCNPGNTCYILKIDLSTFTEVSSITFPEFEFNPFAICSDGIFLYVGFNDIGQIKKINIQSFTVTSSLPIGINFVTSLVTDGTYLYASMNVQPGKVVKIDLSTFTISSTLTLVNNNATALFTDGNYLYVSQEFGIGLITKIDLNTFTEVANLTIADASTINIETLFSDGIYLYAGTGSIVTPGRIVKIDLNTFTEVSTLILANPFSLIKSIFCDSTYIYLSSIGDALGNYQIDKIDLSTFTYISTFLTGITGNSCILYTDGTYIYAGIDTAPGTIVRNYVIPSADQHQRKIDITKDSVQSAISATTSAGNVGGTTLIDTARTEGNDYWNNLSVLLLGGVCKGQVRRISDFDAATDTITVSPAFTAQIATSVKYEIIPTGSGTSTLVQADILSDATPFAGADISIIKADTQVIEDSTLKASPTAGSLSRFIASGGTALGTQLPDSKSLYDVIALDRLDNATYGLSAIETLVDELESRLTATRAGYLDFLATTDNNFSTITANWQTAEATVFQIAQDTRYEITGASVDLTGCTAASVWTFRFYRAYAAAGASYRIAGDTITRIVGTDNPVIELQNWIHYGYTKITAQSNTAGDNGKTIGFTWIKRIIE